MVDNGSTEQTVALVRTRYPRVRVIENRGNRGCGAANNQGIAATNTPLVAVVTPDVLLDMNWSRAMLDPLGSPPE